ncbi:tetratricopeptide repeat protein [Fulvivirgaceae bacterium BMA12]|uniref:Tetratricopeptide repeat protein n=1 Tax=Agaribacillus aureus TaxID=3051825 RepID=A0ABT8LH85_9BACT|nr:tetratricopeptide repeat protein [Fulvivirgaceae bacterium BMA12]
MATKKKIKTKPEKKLLESSEELAEKLSRTEQWVEDNKALVFSVLGAIVLGIGAALFYRYYMNNQDNIAQSEMFQAQYWFEADSLDLALNGDGNNYGFLEVIDNYGKTKAGNLANFYAGVAYMKKGDFDNAILHLNEFDADDKLVQGRAYALIGDAYMEKEEYDNAINFYGKAAAYHPSEYFTPKYLMKEALAYEKLEDFDNAVASYDKIITKYSKSAEIQDARKQKARIASKAAK